MGKLHHNTPMSSSQQVSSVASPSSYQPAVIAARSASTHGKLHKRRHSGSSLINSPQPTDSATFTFKRTDTPRVTYEEPWSDPMLSKSPPSAPGLKLKPYLRKLSSKDNTALDLSRPAAENQSLAGLGIHDFGPASRSASDVTFSPVGRTRHARSTSNTSQFSTTSSLQRPTAPFAHPMRQTPRPYTPPMSRSYNTSLIGTDASDQATDITSDEDFWFRQHNFDHSRTSGPISSSAPNAPPPLHIHTGGSMTRLGNASQASLPTTIRTRSRGDTLRSIDTASPSSRTSVDKAISFIRGRDEPVDPTSRAASIRAARIAYKQKEEAKERKLEQESLKQREKENRKRTKQEERQRRKSDAAEKRARAKSDPLREKTEPIAVAGKEYASLAPAHSRSLPAPIATGRPSSEPRTDMDLSARRAAKSRWLRFLSWFRTRLLRMGRTTRVGA